jgi:hypothetical protein
MEKVHFWSLNDRDSQLLVPDLENQAGRPSSIQTTHETPLRGLRSGIRFATSHVGLGPTLSQQLIE